MREVAPNVQRIINWRESFATLPDTHFFELIRMYLGEVHTPYNKTTLIEELSAFLRKEETKKTIVQLLTESDVQLISAVWFIQNATQEKLAQFFSSTRSFASVYEQLLNLEERLVLYRHGDKKSGKTIISVNPMLEETLKPFLRRDLLLERTALESVLPLPQASITPELLAAFSAFLLENADICKADGTFKKRTVTLLDQYFPGKQEVLHGITRAFLNLVVLKEGERGGIELDRERLEAFSRLDEINQYTLLCIASQGRFSRSGIVRQGQLLLDTIASIPKDGFSRATLLRSAFLISESDNDIPGIAPLGGTSRFSALLSGSRFEDMSASDDAISIIDRLIDTAVLFGLLAVSGTDCDGNPVYVQGSVFSAVPRQERPPFPKVLTIDAGFTVTLLPGLSFSALLPLMMFMELQQFDTVATFEITKKTIMRAFDFDVTQEQIFHLLTEYAAYEIPQNLRISIEDWSAAYASASLYKGYILKVAPELCAGLEKNRRVASSLVEKLAPGVYLLDATTDIDAQIIVGRTRLEHVGKIKCVERKKEVVGFPQIRRNAGMLRENPAAAAESDIDAVRNAISPEEVQQAHLEAMRMELEKLSVLPEQKDGLLDRIQRKIILTPAQLRGDSVRMERIEAGGMDFAGKLHIIDSAMSSNSMIELAYENPTDPSAESIMYVGSPLGVEKLDGDALVRVELIPQHEEKQFSVGKARLVKRIRGSVLK